MYTSAIQLYIRIGRNKCSPDTLSFIFIYDCGPIFSEMGRTASAIGAPACGGLVLCCLLFFSSCAPQPSEEVEAVDVATLQQSPEAQTFVFECGEDYEFVARIEGEKSWLFLPGRTVPLPQVPSGSGAKYSNGKVTFWSRGEEALILLGEQERYNCRNNRARAIWEHAKLNGVSFRAVGNEPGWHLEITMQERIVLVTDYGESRLEFAVPEPETDQRARTTTYRVQDGEHDLTILIEGRPCQDTMSGEEFESAVTVILNEQTLSGCGRALH